MYCIAGNKYNFEIIIIYDGDCIYCDNFTRFIALKKKIKNVKLINARDSTNRLVKKIKKEFNLDEGMVVVFGDKKFYGSDALSFLSSLELTSSSISFLLFFTKYKLISKILYPFMKFGRTVTLFFRGKKRLS